MAFVNAGIPVLIKETTQEALDRGHDKHSPAIMRDLPQEAADQKLALITPQLTFDGFDQADMIVEAVFENLAVKHQVFPRDRYCRENLAASWQATRRSLDIDQIAAVTTRARHGPSACTSSALQTSLRLIEIVRGSAHPSRSHRHPPRPSPSVLARLA